MIEPVEISEGADVFSMWESIGPVAKKFSVCLLMLYVIPLLIAIAIRMDKTSEQFLVLAAWPFILIVLLLVVWLLVATIVALFDTTGSRRALSVILLVPTIIGVVFVVIATAFAGVLTKAVSKPEVVSENGETGTEDD